MASVSSKKTNMPTHRNGSAAQPSSPILSIASVAAGAAGLACGYTVSWMASIVLGIAAAVIGVIAHRKHAQLTWLAKIGIALGIGCIVASFALVAVVSFQMMRLGLA